MCEADAPQPFPFEDRAGIPGFWKRLGATFRLAFSHPVEAFPRLLQGRGLAAPWRFKVLLALPYYLFLSLGAVALTALLLAFRLGNPDHAPRGLVLVGPALLALVLAGGPLFQFLAMVAGGTLLHGLLRLWGGGRSMGPLAQTIRATGYIQGMAALLCLFPGAWMPVYLGSRVVLGLGLARLHRTDAWRGVAAALTQALLMAGLAFAVAVGTLAALFRMDERRRLILPPPALERQEPEGPSGDPQPFQGQDKRL
jgi:hypothetical protein